MTREELRQRAQHLAAGFPERAVIESPVDELNAKLWKMHGQLRTDIIRIGENPSDEDVRDHNRFIADLLFQLAVEVREMSGDFRVMADDVSTAMEYMDKHGIPYKLEGE